MTPTQTHRLISLQQLAAALNGGALSILVIVAHPDDESIAVGGQLSKWTFAHLIHVTNGAPRDREFFLGVGCSSAADYARVRARELDCALAVAGFDSSRNYRLGRIDQEACFDLARLSYELLTFIEALKPEIIVTHAYEGGHPDHDAVAFAAQAACYLGISRGLRVPMRAEAPFYHRSDGGLRVAQFLAEPALPNLELNLDDHQRHTKERMLNCFETQRTILAPFPRDRERFRLAPAYDFTAPPHPGALHYETLGWRIDGALFRKCARLAMQALQIPESGSPKGTWDRPWP